MEAEINKIKVVAQLNGDGYFVGMTEADADPLEEGNWLMPAGTVDAPKPEDKNGFVARWDFEKSAWQYIENHVGEKVYSTDDGGEIEVKELGALPENTTSTPRPSKYHTWNGSEWDITPESSAQRIKDARLVGTDSINNTIAGAYERFMRFKAEYELRETQAQAFKDAGYAGEVPSQVAAFATPAGKTAKEAADIILQQAVNLRSALDALGVLRMRKFELYAIDDADAIEARVAEIIAAVNVITEKL